MISELKSCQSKAKFVLYQWDSQENFPYIKSIQKYFDECYSFDKRDVKETPNLRFLPLFYSKMYEKIGEKIVMIINMIFALWEQLIRRNINLLKR